MGQDYTFGDSDLAADRLGLLSETVAVGTRRAIEGLPLPDSVNVVTDLGCGPGHSTAILHDVLGARTTTGMDDSPDHLERARRALPHLRFQLHDVTEAPIPTPPADLVHARFLVTHLADPVGALRLWGEALAPGGLLAVQETEHLRTDHETLLAYYHAVDRLQQHQGQCLYIGPDLEGMATRAGLRRVSSHVRHTIVAGRVMARIHRLNLASWRATPAARSLWDDGELDRLDDALRAAERDGRPQFVVDHGMRVIALCR